MGAAAAVFRNVNDSCNEERINLSVLDNARRSRLKLSQGIQGRHWEKNPPSHEGGRAGVSIAKVSGGASSQAAWH